MNYEIEKRALLKSEKEYDAMKSVLDQKYGTPKELKMHTLLFRDPKYLRVRKIEGEKTFFLTTKSGDYSDVSRKEIEVHLPTDQLDNMLRLIKSIGFERCSKIITHRLSYSDKQVKIELNKIDYLGMIVEVEALTDNKNDISELSTLVATTMQDLGLQELEAETYQKMMDEMFEKSLEHIDSITK